MASKRAAKAAKPAAERFTLEFHWQGAPVEALAPLPLSAGDFERRGDKMLLGSAVRIEAPDVRFGSVPVDSLVLLRGGETVGACPLQVPVTVGGAALAEFAARTLIF